MDERVINAIIFYFILFVTVSGTLAYTPKGYLGCYDMRSLRQRYGRRFSMNTGDKCMTLCLDRKFRYAASKHSLCICGDLLRDEYVEAMKCFVECPGNRNEICGGIYGEISLYDIWQTTSSTIPQTRTEPTTTTTTTTTSTTTTSTTTTSTTTTNLSSKTSGMIEVTKVALASKTSSSTNSSEGVSKNAFENTDDKYKYHIMMYVSIPATVAIVGIFAVIIIVVYRVTRRKHQPVHVASTSRIEIATEDNVPRDDDSVHIYDQCTCSEDVTYHSNGMYLTPVTSTVGRLHEDEESVNKEKEKSCQNNWEPPKRVSNAMYTSKFIGAVRPEVSYEELLKKDTADNHVYHTAYN